MTEGPNAQQFKLGPDDYVFGDQAGNQIKSISTAWETAVLKAHGVKPERDECRRLSPACLAKLREIDLNFHDLRHEAGSRKLEAAWHCHAVSKWMGPSKIDTTSTYLNAETRLLHELNERVPLTLVKG